MLLSKYSGRVLQLLTYGALNPFTQEEFDKRKLLEGIKGTRKTFLQC
jgi:hypothetical protein